MKGEAGGGAYNAVGTPQSIQQRIGRQRAVHSLCELRNASISAAAGGDQGKSSSALDKHKFGELSRFFFYLSVYLSFFAEGLPDLGRSLYSCIIQDGFM